MIVPFDYPFDDWFTPGKRGDHQPLRWGGSQSSLVRWGHGAGNLCFFLDFTGNCNSGDVIKLCMCVCVFCLSFCFFFIPVECRLD